MSVGILRAFSFYISVKPGKENAYHEFKSEPGHVDGLEEGEGRVVLLVVLLVALREVRQRVQRQHDRRDDDERNRDDSHDLKKKKIM